MQPIKRAVSSRVRRQTWRKNRRWGTKKLLLPLLLLLLFPVFQVQFHRWWSSSGAPSWSCASSYSASRHQSMILSVLVWSVSGNLSSVCSWWFQRLGPPRFSTFLCCSSWFIYAPALAVCLRSYDHGWVVGSWLFYQLKTHNPNFLSWYTYLATRSVSILVPSRDQVKTYNT